MHLFTDYVQPLTGWLQENPRWALLITFLISFAESLAIIGSLIPGSVTMTAIGILAGSGVMRIDLTFVAAILGAIAGDGLSYLIGIIFKDRLTHIFPFNRYPNLLKFGTEYFQKHGGKSVLIGRFIGPLRSIIPVIAGMLNMNHYRFLAANVLSAIGWSWLYITPGLVIGAASSELSTESATRFFILILVMLGGIWLLTLLIKWILLTTHRFLRYNLHQLWAWSMKHPFSTRCMKKLTPDAELDFYPTALLVIMTLFCFIFFVLLITCVHMDVGITKLDEPIHLFLQSIRTHTFDVIFIFFAESCHALVILTLLLITGGLLVLTRNPRYLCYWLSIALTCFLLALIIQISLNVPRPSGLMYVKASSSFPSVNLTVLTGLCLTILFYLKSRSNNIAILSAKILFALLPLGCGFALLYLGDHWLTDIIVSYVTALLIVMLHWLFVRRHPIKKIGNASHLIILIIIITLMTTLSFIKNKTHALVTHKPYLAHFVINNYQWWHQVTPILPIYRTNRIGQRVSLFNVQYVGSLHALQTMLRINGWQTTHDTLLKAIVKRISGLPSAESPLLAPLYINRKPSLIMTYHPLDNSATLVLRLWRSNYHLDNDDKSIWLGSLQEKIPQPTKWMQQKTIILNYLHLDNSLFIFKQFAIPISKIKALPIAIHYKILLIKEREYFEDDSNGSIITV